MILSPCFFPRSVSGVCLVLAGFVGLNVAGQQIPTLSGIWTWRFTTPNGDAIEASVDLKQDGEKLTGAYKAGGNERKIEEGSITKEGEVSFAVVRERDGQKSFTRLRGKLSGDTIKGTIESNFGGTARTRDWDAKRYIKPTGPGGKWQWVYNRDDGQVMNFVLQLKRDGEKVSGISIGPTGTETPIQEGTFRGDKVSFKVVRERDGRFFTSLFQGEIVDDVMQGTMEVDWSGEKRSFPWTAKRGK